MITDTQKRMAKVYAELRNVDANMQFQVTIPKVLSIEIERSQYSSTALKVKGLPGFALPNPANKDYFL